MLSLTSKPKTVEAALMPLASMKQDLERIAQDEKAAALAKREEAARLIGAADVHDAEVGRANRAAEFLNKLFN